ncbi:MarR family transcriptional regulator [Pseudonocardia ailaonensis]|uniref:MarR family transcriptional regulator n=1 Tax=Pseudonocardia ailaonensis TaxID=367279 RepID=A0ABN2NJL7_9PSEU
MDERDPAEVAAALLAGVGTLVRRVRLVPTGALSMPQRAALAAVERSGPTTSAALAREMQITAQAMGATLGELGEGGLVDRRKDPDDGRRVVLTITATGRQALQDKRNGRVELLARALTGGAFTPAELELLAAAAPLLERLAQGIPDGPRR